MYDEDRAGCLTFIVIVLIVVVLGVCGIADRNAKEEQRDTETAERFGVSTTEDLDELLGNGRYEVRWLGGYEGDEEISDITGGGKSSVEVEYTSAIYVGILTDTETGAKYIVTSRGGIAPLSDDMAIADEDEDKGADTGETGADAGADTGSTGGAAQNGQAEQGEDVQAGE